MARFEPDERHALRSDDGARVLLLLAPWPGEGHYRGSGGRPAGLDFFGALRSSRRRYVRYAVRSTKYVSGMNARA